MLGAECTLGFSNISFVDTLAEEGASLCGPSLVVVTLNLRVVLKHLLCGPGRGPTVHGVYVVDGLEAIYVTYCRVLPAARKKRCGSKNRDVPPGGVCEEFWAGDPRNLAQKKFKSD